MILMLQAPEGFEFPLIALLVAFTTLFVKGSVDVVKGLIPSLPGRALPLVGIVLGYIYCIIALIAAATPLNTQIFAQVFFAAMLIQFGAMGSTAVHNWANEKRGIHQNEQTRLD